MTRRTWTYTVGGRPLETPLEVTVGGEPEGYNASGERVPVVTDRHHEGTRAPDGTDIGSRAKRREWMRLNGVADYSDYTNHLATATRVREEWRAGRAAPDKELRETVGRVAYELKQRRRT